jgi:putative DNA primase/helicase
MSVADAEVLRGSAAARVSALDLLESALAHAARGHRVHPVHGIRNGRCTCGSTQCAASAKHPRLKNWPKEATTDEATIRTWWRRWPDSNIGMLTGIGSGVIVLDIDPRNGGNETLDRLEEVHGALPKTVEVQTGGGGRHKLFLSPGHEIKSRQLGPGLDLHADGGHSIVVPPARHASGQVYKWSEGLDPGSISPAPLPDALAEPPGRNRHPQDESCSDESTQACGLEPGSTSAWAEAALRNECAAIRAAAPGTRNVALNRAAYSLGQLIPGGWLHLERVRTELLDAAHGCKLVEDDGLESVHRTIKSGLQTGQQTRRDPPSYPPNDIADRHLREQSRDSGGVLPGRSGATDVANAERFAEQHCATLRYCHPWGSWVVWDGKRWMKDRTGEAMRRAKQTVRSIYLEASRLESPERERLARHAIASESTRRLTDMLKLGQSDARIAIVPEAFDAEATRYLFNVLNGTVDLREQVLQPHQPTDFITMLAPVEFDPKATSPDWDDFLDVVLPDGEVRAFLQRYAGYSLTGDTSEQAFTLLYGKGANGKSTILETLKCIFGDYAQKADFETFLEAKSSKDSRGGARVDLLALAGRRLVIAAEAGDGRRLDTNTIKELTGGDTLTARGLYHREQTSFRPQAKLVLATNHRPEIRESTDAIWRRIYEIPFAVTIPVEDQDKDLPERLREPANLSGVLNWLMQGCRAWMLVRRSPRLRPPAAVCHATRAYRQDQDAIAPFLDACCVNEASARVTHKDLRARYVAWCAASDEEPISERALSRGLEDHGYRKERGKDKTRTRGFVGLSLRELTDASIADASDSDASDACA